MGYSKAMNYGYAEAIQNGIVTSAELMIGMPGTEHAVEILKKYPWIPVGWHIHVFGKPSADPKLVPRLLDENGYLNLKISRGHPQDKSLYSELYIELKAELEKYIDLLGKKPDVISNVDDRDDPYSEVLRVLATEYHINHIFRNTSDKTSVYRKWIYDTDWRYEEYPLIVLPTHAKWDTVQTQVDQYEPEKLFLEKYKDVFEQEDGVALIVFHPGFVDSFILENSTCNIARCLDVKALTSEKVKNFLKQKGVELITTNDYLYGTHDYKDFLEHRDS